jgi:hypothetical protein
MTSFRLCMRSTEINALHEPLTQPMLTDCTDCLLGRHSWSIMTMHYDGEKILNVLRTASCTGQLIAVCRWNGPRELGRARFDYYAESAGEVIGNCNILSYAILNS